MGEVVNVKNTDNRGEVVDFTQVDLKAYDKRFLVDELENGVDRLRETLDFDDSDREKAKDLNIEIIGLDEYGVFTKDELKALLCKLVPMHLLEGYQSVKKIVFKSKVLLPMSSQGNLVKKEVAESSSSRRIICRQKRDGDTIETYSVAGLTDDLEIKKLLVLNAIIHDLGHGVVNSFFADQYNDESKLNWLIYLGNIFGYGKALTDKSAGYIVDSRKVKEVETWRDRADIAINRAIEDFAEAFRLRALDLTWYTEAMSKRGNRSKRFFFDLIWDQNFDLKILQGFSITWLKDCLDL